MKYERAKLCALVIKMSLLFYGWNTGLKNISKCPIQCERFNKLTEFCSYGLHSKYYFKHTLNKPMQQFKKYFEAQASI